MPGAADGYGSAEGPGSREGTGAAGGLGIEGPREVRDARRFSHEAMASVFEVHGVHPDERYAAQAAQAAFDLLDRLERELSRFLSSDIGGSAIWGRASTRVSP
jgi:hypothetical protein